MGIQDIGDNVRRLMKLRALTIPKLSERTGMGTAALSNILNRKAEPRCPPSSRSPMHSGSRCRNSCPTRPGCSRSGSAPRSLSAHGRRRHATSSSTTPRYGSPIIGSSKNYYTATQTGAVRQTGRNASEAAMAVRKQLGIDSRASINDIAELIEKRASGSESAPFGYKKTFGLSVGDHDGGPAIVVNSETGYPSSDRFSPWRTSSDTCSCTRIPIMPLAKRRAPKRKGRQTFLPVPAAPR